MTTILITNAISFGVAVLTFLSVATARRRRRRRRVQRIYLTLDGRQVTRDEPL
jgi:hypothetical protein